MKNKETIIAVHASDQPGTILGKMVNYPMFSVYGDSEEELIKRAKEVLEMEKEMIDDILTGKCELEIQYENTEMDWLYKSEINIPYWFIEKLQYALYSREDIKEKLQDIIEKAITESNNEMPYNIAQDIIKAIIKYDNK